MRRACSDAGMSLHETATSRIIDDTGEDRIAAHLMGPELAGAFSVSPSMAALVATYAVRRGLTFDVDLTGDRNLEKHRPLAERRCRCGKSEVRTPEACGPA
jgi:hypothetical protein